MDRSKIVLLGAVGFLGACAAATPALSDHPASAFVAPGWESYDASHVRRDIICDGRPVLLSGNHTRIHLSGDCTRVRVAGWHNDVFVDLAPGGMIEITGAHNDVTWRTSAPTPRPRLVDSGGRNTFHIARG